MTVFLRAGTDEAEDTIAVDCPALAELTEIIRERKPDMILLTGADYEKAEAEMLSVLRGRGYTRLAIGCLPQRHFLLFGVAIVMEA